MLRWFKCRRARVLRDHYMGSIMTERKRVGRSRQSGLMHLPQIICCFMMMLSYIKLASAGRPSAIASGSEALNAGLKLEKPTHVVEVSSTKGKWNQLEYSNIVSRVELLAGRRHLNGPGSTPPHCTSKCRTCNPCVPVRAAIKSGMVKLAAYYPQAWRCQCRGNFYMP